MGVAGRWNRYLHFNAINLAYFTRLRGQTLSSESPLESSRVEGHGCESGGFGGAEAQRPTVSTEHRACTSAAQSSGGAIPITQHSRSEQRGAQASHVVCRPCHFTLEILDGGWSSEH